MWLCQVLQSDIWRDTVYNGENGTGYHDQTIQGKLEIKLMKYISIIIYELMSIFGMESCIGDWHWI